MQLGRIAREGDVLADKYRVERILGEGGMGMVVAAHHIHLDERVAIKFLRPEMLAHPEAMSRFAREARAAVKIKSEHVVRVLDVGTLESGEPYMVMEFLDGGDLAAWLKRRGPLPVKQAVDFVLQAGIAVAEAHGLGIVHRDLKPSNLFCVRGADGRFIIKVLDFGISKMTSITNSAPGPLTQTGALMGSPLYMSPEQLRSPKDAGPSADIWALGVALYELVTGSPPFPGDTQAELCIRIVTEPPRPLRDMLPHAPSGFETALMRCLEKDPRRRFADVAELAAALLPFGPPHAQSAVDRIRGIIRGGGARSFSTATAASVSPLPQIAGPSQQTISAVALTPTTGARGLQPSVPVTELRDADALRRPARRKLVVFAAAAAGVVCVGLGIGIRASMRAPSNGNDFDADRASAHGAMQRGVAPAPSFAPAPVLSVPPSSAPELEAAPTAAAGTAPVASPLRRSSPKPRSGGPMGSAIPPSAQVTAGATPLAAPQTSGNPSNVAPTDPLQNLRMKN
jgi:serine/threonine protein kinase